MEVCDYCTISDPSYYAENNLGQQFVICEDCFEAEIKPEEAGSFQVIGLYGRNWCFVKKVILP